MSLIFALIPEYQKHNNYYTRADEYMFLARQGKFWHRVSATSAQLGIYRSPTIYGGIYIGKDRQNLYSLARHINTCMGTSNMSFKVLALGD